MLQQLLAPSKLLTKATNAYRTLNYYLSHSFYLYALQHGDKYQDPRHLARHGYKVYSQSEEDGLLAEILRRIGSGPGFFVEFGVGNGLENNTLALLLNGWSGAWIEGSPGHAARIEEHFAGLMDRGRLHFRRDFVTAENVEGLFRELGVPDDFDLLGIDIDGNDYWVWKALTAFRPKVVAIEYNPSLGPSADAKVPYDPARRWDRTRAFGASLKALENLGRDKGYVLVGCNFTGSNAFFVRAELAGDRFLTPATSEVHWEPARYFLEFYTGHRLDYSELQAFF